MKVEIYTKVTCGFCHHAKALLTKKKVKFSEYKIDADPQLRKKMIGRSNGASTVPQVFINDKHIGGCDDLYALENADKLDALLK